MAPGTGHVETATTRTDTITNACPAPAEVPRLWGQVSHMIAIGGGCPSLKSCQRQEKRPQNIRKRNIKSRHEHRPNLPVGSTANVKKWPRPSTPVQMQPEGKLVLRPRLPADVIKPSSRVIDLGSDNVRRFHDAVQSQYSRMQRPAPAEGPSSSSRNRGPPESVIPPWHLHPAPADYQRPGRR